MIGHAIPALHVWYKMADSQGTGMNALALNDVTEPREAGEEEERRFVCGVETKVVVGCVVPVAVEQLELACIFVAPTAWDMVLAEVVVVEKVAGGATRRVEA